MTQQLTFSDLEIARYKKTTRRSSFLDDMEKVVPFARFESLIEPHYHKNKLGRRAYPLRVMLRLHLLQNWYALSDRDLEDELHDSASFQRFARLSTKDAKPDATTILNFRHLLEANDLGKSIFEAVNALLSEQKITLKIGTIVDATLIEAPTSTKNLLEQRDPEMHQTKKGNEWYFGAKVHVGVDASTGLVHSVEMTAANVADITQAAACLHGEEKVVLADAGYTGLEKREEMQKTKAELVIAAKRSVIAKLPDHVRGVARETEYVKSAIRARVEHVFKVLKCEFGYVKVRFRGIAKNLCQVRTLMALVNLKKARHAITGEVRPAIG
jgi:transposase, IS5 family